MSDKGYTCPNCKVKNSGKRWDESTFLHEKREEGLEEEDRGLMTSISEELVGYYYVCPVCTSRVEFTIGLELVETDF